MSRFCSYLWVVVLILVDKTTLIENKAKIEKCLAKHFRETGKDNLLSHRYQARVKTFL
jgi:hypothetical protein